MNIIIKNTNANLVEEFDDEVIKTLEGEFTIDQVQEKITSVYYNKVIIDITAIKDYGNIDNVIKFLRIFDHLKIIIVLKAMELNKQNMIVSKLIENGYYNFATNVNEIKTLMAEPNSSQNVEKYFAESSSNLNPMNMDLDCK